MEVQDLYYGFQVIVLLVFFNKQSKQFHNINTTFSLLCFQWPLAYTDTFILDLFIARLETSSNVHFV